LTDIGPVNHALGGRDLLDRYYTPAPVARACVGLLRIAPRARVLEPSSGGGAFLDAILAAQPTAVVRAFDVDPNAPSAARFKVERQDFLRYRHRGPMFDWIIGNPPYFEAEDHVRKALRTGKNVAFLLRLGFAESQARVPFWKGIGKCLREVRVLASRPSFTNGGTDATAYGFFIWAHNHRGPSRIVPCWDFK